VRTTVTKLRTLNAETSHGFLRGRRVKPKPN
jgi:hypothetical protein